MSRSAGRRHRGRRLALRVLFELEGTTKDAAETLRYQAEDESAPADVDHQRLLVEDQRVGLPPPVAPGDADKIPPEELEDIRRMVQRMEDDDNRRFEGHSSAQPIRNMVAPG